MFEQGGDVALDLFKLVELQGGVNDGEDVAGAGLIFFKSFCDNSIVLRN